MKPDDWDPIHPPDGVCIYCYRPSSYYVAWRYDVNCVCSDASCVKIARRSTGFIGVFNEKEEAVAVRLESLKEKEHKRERKRRNVV